MTRVCHLVKHRRPRRQGRRAGSRLEIGEGLVEVLVALFILGLVSTAFLSLSGAFMRGLLAARQKEAAVRCAQDVIEQVRAGGGRLPQPGSCGDSTFPDLEYELKITGPAESIVTVAVYGRRPPGGSPVYEVTTARFLGVSPP